MGDIPKYEHPGDQKSQGYRPHWPQEKKVQIKYEDEKCIHREGLH
jgi:hypothetical protein